MNPTFDYIDNAIQERLNGAFIGTLPNTSFNYPGDRIGFVTQFLIGCVDDHPENYNSKTALFEKNFNESTNNAFAGSNKIAINFPFDNRDDLFDRLGQIAEKYSPALDLKRITRDLRFPENRNSHIVILFLQHKVLMPD